jgi:hypothetical protein
MSRWWPGRSDPAQALERQYRRLLAWYPGSFRAAYAEEMVGVAMARSAPGQRRPDIGETANLIVSGIRTRFGAIRTGVREPAWRDAAAVLSVIGPILVAASSARTIGGQLGPFRMPPPEVAQVAGVPVATTAGWMLVALAAILGRRRIAAAGAALGVTGQAAVLGVQYSADPSGLVTSWWKIVFAMVIAVSAFVAIGGENRPLSRRAIAATMAAAALLGAWPAVETASVTAISSVDGGTTFYSPLFGVQGLATDAVLGLNAIVLLVVVGRLGSAVRRRVVILLLPTAGVMALVTFTFGGFLAASPRFANPVLLTAPQWVALALVPVAVLLVGLVWLARYERMLNRVAGAGAQET